MDKSTKEIISLGITLLIITAIAGFILGGAHKITAEPIAIQQKKENDAAMKEVLPKAESFEKQDVKIEEGNLVLEVNAGKTGSDVAGYAIKVAPKGYGGLIEMMVGISNEGKVEGIKILAHTETPGLGAKAPEAEFADQYKQKSIEKKLVVVKADPANDNEIKAITGATITSAAVTTGVNAAVDFYNDELKGGQK
ncbi:RnfABCDGE type electron transport complex subunit G [Clostridium ganghwense]|uniref:Ion-translocating oxidoreductase complex subunit G n=1 Tax=Clostridium ganghwense TaxID=312089 RepID=A0ABT4CPF7_9CLOT|nr:RnfABCDGE type electron transport complex subunit G [Clostridium ganghwense]MCY6370935.1 RnfABCDGE type electron transport complex subunit G [Clostridium ganghwense]